MLALLCALPSAMETHEGRPDTVNSVLTADCEGDGRSWDSLPSESSGGCRGPHWGLRMGPKLWSFAAYLQSQARPPKPS